MRTCITWISNPCFQTLRLLPSPQRWYLGIAFILEGWRHWNEKRYRMKEEDRGFGNTNTERMSRERGDHKEYWEKAARRRRKTRQGKFQGSQCKGRTDQLCVRLSETREDKHRGMSSGHSKTEIILVIRGDCGEQL